MKQSSLQIELTVPDADARNRNRFSGLLLSVRGFAFDRAHPRGSNASNDEGGGITFSPHDDDDFIGPRF